MEDKRLDVNEYEEYDTFEEINDSEEIEELDEDVSEEELFKRVEDLFEEYMWEDEEEIEELEDPEEPEFLSEEELLAAMEGDYEDDDYEEDSDEDVDEDEEGEYDEYLENDTENENREPDVLYDSEGNPVEFAVEGSLELKEIPIDEIFLPPRTRKPKLGDTDYLEATILQWGLVEPLHVIPFNGKYLLVHGFRRYQALRNLKYNAVTCIVDSTRPKATIRFLEVLCNNSKKFDFFEMMNFGEFIERKQSTFKTDTIEKIIGLDPGDYLKAKYLRQFDSFGIISEVASGKKTIKEGFKKLEKEMAKAEKEKEELGNVELDENGVPISYLEAIEEEANIQSTKDRKPLPPHVYGRIKARDHYTCQTCGIGHNQPELAAIHEVHHIKPVAKGGSDDDSNLILLCSNCHKVVTAYIDGNFKAPDESEEMYKNMVLLGNIARKGIPDKEKPYKFYMANSDQPWVD